jgi:hypothetical protein
VACMATQRLGTVAGSRLDRLEPMFYGGPEALGASAILYTRTANISPLCRTPTVLNAYCMRT